MIIYWLLQMKYQDEQYLLKVVRPMPSYLYVIKRT